MFFSNSQNRYFSADRDINHCIIFLSWVLIIFIYVALRINIIDVPLDRDEGMFGYMGQLILDGGLPYRDALDHKPPVVFYLNALALRFVPSTAVGIHVFLQFYNFLTLISLFFLTKIYFRSYTTGLWTGLSYAIFSSSPAIQGLTASTEMFMLLPITISLLCAVLAVRKQKLLFVVLSGMTGALACWTKQTAVFSIFFVVTYLVLAQMSPSVKQSKTQLLAMAKSLIVWGIGGIAISLLIGAYFYYHGIFDNFLYWSFKHSLLYSQGMPLTEKMIRVLKQITNIAKGDFVLVGVGIFAGMISIRRQTTSSLFILGFLGFSLLGTIPGFAYKHYFAQLAPAVAIGAGFGFSVLIDSVSSYARRVAVSLFCVALIVFVPVVVHSGYYLKWSPDRISRAFFGPNPFPESEILAEFIASHTGVDDTVYILGSEPQILFLAKRKSATSHVMIYPLMQNYPRYREFQRETLKEIRHSPPKYILTFISIPSSFLWDGKADPSIIGEINKIIARDYIHEALMVIGRERGHLLDLSVRKDINVNKAMKSRNVIKIYRRKS